MPTVVGVAAAEVASIAPLAGAEALKALLTRGLVFDFSYCISIIIGFLLMSYVWLFVTLTPFNINARNASSLLIDISFNFFFPFLQIKTRNLGLI